MSICPDCGRLISDRFPLHDCQPVKLPEKPVDQYSFKYFMVSVTDTGVHIDEVQVIYHANTKMGGWSAPVVDQWFVTCNGNFVGRVKGWANIVKNNPPNHYATRVKALSVAIEQYQIKIAACQTQLQELQDKQQNLLDELRRAEK